MLALDDNNVIKEEVNKLFKGLRNCYESQEGCHQNNLRRGIYVKQHRHKFSNHDFRKKK